MGLDIDHAVRSGNFRICVPASLPELVQCGDDDFARYFPQAHRNRVADLRVLLGRRATKLPILRELLDE